MLNHRCWIAGPGIVALAALALLTGCTSVTGSGVAATETRSVGVFDCLEISGAASAEFEIGEATPLRVTADDNILPLVMTEVRNGCLHVYTRGSTSQRVAVRVTGSVPKIVEIDCSGASTARVRGLSGSDLSIDASGASKVEAKGTAKKVTVDASGASKMMLAELVADAVHFNLSGASTLYANATGELTGDASGASTVRYQGKPAKVQTGTSGASTVKAAE